MTMDGMPMPGGWTMSMAWMRMPGQTWADALAAFLGMWVPMMVGMMLPSVTRPLCRYRRALAGSGASHPVNRVAVAGMAYFAVWTLFGIVIFPFGAAFAEVAMAFPAVARAVPAAAGVVVIVAGALQLTAWKARRLACCRAALARGDAFEASASAAWRNGMRLGLQCIACCSGLTAVLLVVGVMDVSAMIAVTAAITLERLAPAGERAARIVGVVAIGTGALLVLA
jgi:predicted metal-binding membrane protein